jgi:hypothetical protein
MGAIVNSYIGHCYDVADIRKADEAYQALTAFVSAIPSRTR